jgi:arginyl-tRNA synthetase
MAVTVTTTRDPYPQLIFKGSQLAGWTKPTDRVEHVGFGVVTGADKKRLKTRAGETVRLVDLLDDARKQMHASLEV